LLEGCPIVGSRIPDRLLVACGSFDAGLSGARVARAIARGLQAGGLPEPDLCALDEGAEHEPGEGDEVSELQLLRGRLERLDFDMRLHRARALIIAAARLEERTLAGSMTFEVATRARQGGIPAYAVTAQNTLSGFDGRILDLQLILEAATASALTSAGRRLARVV
jgi:glycerate kinase